MAIEGVEMKTQVSPQQWIESKASLKQEIVSYFSGIGADRNAIAHACAFIKNWGEIQGEFESSPMKADDECLSGAFSPIHREKAASWINRYGDLHKAALEYLEDQRKYGEKTNWARDDFEGEDWASTQPDGEIQIHADHIKVFAFGFTEGFAKRLPRSGKKSIGKTIDGDYEWQYPLSAIAPLSKLGLPILKSIEAK
jgi:hypothetical protein